MKIGVFISITVVAIVTGIVIMALREPPDKETQFSSPAMLAIHDFSKLPPLINIGATDASAAYEAVFQFRESHKEILDNTVDKVARDVCETAVDLLIAAGEAGTVTAKFLDDDMPLRAQAAPRFGDALLMIQRVALDNAFIPVQEKFTERERERALRAAKASFAVGLTLYEKSRRVPTRGQGLDIMGRALDRLAMWGGKGNEFYDNVMQWSAALATLDADYWDPKYKVTYSTRLNTSDFAATIADLVKYATDDKDVSWRTEATLSLGRVKFMVGRGHGNDRLVRDAIARLKTDRNATVAAAAKLADAVTKEDVRKWK